MWPPLAPACLSAQPPAPRTSSGHSRFLHGLPPLATGVGDVGAVAVHGAQPRAGPPRERAQTAGSPGPACGWDGRGGRRPVPRSRARLTCVLPERWEETAPSKPRLPQPRASRCAARAWRLGGDGQRPVREAAQVPSTAAEAARRCPTGEAGRVEEPGSPVWNAGLARARWRRAP